MCLQKLVRNLIEFRVFFLYLSVLTMWFSNTNNNLFIYICFGTQTRTVDQKDTAAHSYGCMKICCSFSFPPFAKLAAVNGASSGKRKSAEGLLTCSRKTWSLCRVFLSIWINSRFILRDMSKRRQSCQWKNLISSLYYSWGINKKDKLFKVFVCH